MTGKRFVLPFRVVLGLPIFGLLLLWSGVAAAAEDHPVRHGEGRLWKIERGDAPPSHVMGTIHIADPRVRDLPPAIRRAFESSEQAAFEVLFAPDERQAVREAARLPAGYSLAGLLGKDAYEKLTALAAAYGLPEKRIDKFHPFFLMYFFSVPWEEHQRQIDGDLVLDEWLIQWAYDIGMRVEALETYDEHLQAIDRLSLEDHGALLRGSIEALDEDPAANQTLIHDYLAGDMSRVYRDLEESIAADRDGAVLRFKEAFLDLRNRAMVKRMLPLLERGKAFVAVGALHMPGDEGILHLLEQRGYRVTRVY